MVTSTRVTIRFTKHPLFLLSTTLRFAKWPLLFFPVAKAVLLLKPQRANTPLSNCDVLLVLLDNNTYETSDFLDFELEAPANASKFVEDPLPALLGRTQKKVLGETAPHTREHRSFQNDATRLASKDKTLRPLTSPSSRTCPVLWSLIPSCQLTSQASLLT